ncbi:hypothetical protein GQ55_9G644800 [Panicum hallii var. hallii]|uniref:Uncharacterized protein n=1 Tax=Panicum hallii var. hallii TaxID=1504633 RepID=A0A2T7CIP7_9POAL|nr:hypothetical protein GQ55_9G644800 [Panicum hallii var. hallii]
MALQSTFQVPTEERMEGGGSQSRRCKLANHAAKKKESQPCPQADSCSDRPRLYCPTQPARAAPNQPKSPRPQGPNRKAQERERERERETLWLTDSSRVWLVSLPFPLSPSPPACARPPGQPPKPKAGGPTPAGRFYAESPLPHPANYSPVPPSHSIPIFPSPTRQAAAAAAASCVAPTGSGRGGGVARDPPD